MSEPVVSVLTVCLNAARTILSTIRSLRVQTLTEWEHIVVDGGSTDGTVELVQKNADQRTTLVVTAGAGIYESLNIGVQRASGRYITFLHADDFYAHRRVLELFVVALETTGNPLAYGDIAYVMGTDPCRVVRVWRAGTPPSSLMRTGWMPPHTCTFVDRKVALKHPFDTTLTLSADHRWFLELIEIERLSLSYVPGVHVIMRTGGASTATLRARIELLVQDARAWQKTGLGNGWYTAVVKRLRKLHQFFALPRSPHQAGIPSDYLNWICNERT